MSVQLNSAPFPSDIFFRRLFFGRRFCSARSGDTNKPHPSGPKVPRTSLTCEMWLWTGQPLGQPWGEMVKSQNYQRKQTGGTMWIATPLTCGESEPRAHTGVILPGQRGARISVFSALHNN